MSQAEIYFNMEEVVPLIRESLASGQSVRMHPYGTSMLPMIRQGIDSVVLSPVPENLKRFDIPLYRRENGKYILHRIISGENLYTCRGDNQFIDETGILQNQIIAVVTGFYRGDKYHSVKEIPYRIYCFFWYYSYRLRRFWFKVLRRLKRIMHNAKKGV